MGDEKKQTMNEYLASIAPEVSSSFRALRTSALAAGPLDHDVLELVVLTSFVTSGMKSAFVGHARRALSNGLPKQNIQHAIIATLGASLPMATVVEALQWLDDCE